MNNFEIFKDKNSLTRECLVKAIRRDANLTINSSIKIVDAMIKFMMNEICLEKEIRIRLFGTFSSKSKSERRGRNPRTLVEAKITARKVVKFKVAPKLKKMINDNIHLIP